MAESKARNTDERYSKLTIGVCPDQWGVWFPEDDKQIHWETVLDEMAEAGFSVMETGPFGYFPKDPKRLQEEMDQRGFKVVAGTGSLVAKPAFLDLADPDLSTVARTLVESGHRRAVVVPLLFTVAFHATVDVPEAVQANGSTEVSVVPGVIAVSRTTNEPSASTMKSERDQSRRPRVRWAWRATSPSRVSCSADSSA